MQTKTASISTMQTVKVDKYKSDVYLFCLIKVIYIKIFYMRPILGLDVATETHISKPFTKTGF